MSEQVKRYRAHQIPESGRAGLWVHAGDFNQKMNQAKEREDALHAEAEALRANIVRLTSNPADHRYWEGRYRDAEAGLEAARGLLDSTRPHVVELLEFIFSRFGSPITADELTDRAVAAVRALEKFTATPAPEVPDHLRDSAKMVEQGEQQEAVCMRSVGRWGKSLAAIWPEDEAEQDGPWVIGTIDEDGNKYPVVSIDADQYDAPGDSKLLAEKLQALWAAAFTTPQPGPDVRALAASLYQACGEYDMPERILDALSAAASGEPFAHMIDGLLPCVPPSDQDVRGAGGGDRHRSSAH